MKPYIINLKIRLLATAFLLFLITCSSSAQKRQDSEALVVYDYTSPESRAQVPFDKFFTLQVLHFQTKKINTIRVYEADFIQGNRTLKTDFVEKNDDKTPHSVFDFEIPESDHKAKHDTLILSFPPLKPNKEFDVIVTQALSAGNLDLALKLNEAIHNKKSSAEQELLFKKLKAGATDPFFVTSFGVENLAKYIDIFKAEFQPYYDNSTDKTNFPSVPFLTMHELNQMNAGYIEKKMKFYWGHVPVRLISEAKLDDMFAGVLPADYSSSTKKADYTDYNARMSNLGRSIAIIDTIYRNLNTFLFKDNDPAFSNMQHTLGKVKDQLVANQRYFSDRLNDIADAIEANKQLLETKILVSNTKAKDIKTEGSNIFTLDLGVATVGGFNVNDKMVLLPKFYYGVNIYFRPIDKNTRKERLPSGLEADPVKGPDYNIASQRSIWQHLSFTIGLTTGSYSNKEFDNLYANTSLLLGFGYRFWRPLKITAGTAILRRTSKNPIITDKGVAASPFISLSADIDFVSTIEKVISPLWK